MSKFCLKDIRGESKTASCPFQLEVNRGKGMDVTIENYKYISI